ncbi:hypothetical protein [Pedobacter petrophilus]|nr:hypothetical protein [Pedobacter petrophilus]
MKMQKGEDFKINIFKYDVSSIKLARLIGANTFYKNMALSAGIQQNT